MVINTTIFLAIDIVHISPTISFDILIQAMKEVHHFPYVMYSRVFSPHHNLSRQKSGIWPDCDKLEV